MLVWFFIFEICESDDLSLLENSVCIESGYKVPCSGHGICIDGHCLCESLEDVDPLYRYSGRYCEECPYCKGQRCEKVSECVKCLKTPTCSADNFCDNISVDSLVTNTSLDEKSCFIEDENGCFITFKYAYENGELIVFGGDKKECYNGYQCESLRFY